MVRALVVAAVSVVTPGCAFDLAQAKVQLTPRAVTELSCKASSLEFEEVQRPLAPSNVKVTGCGRTAEYTLEESVWRPVRKAPRPR